MSDFRRFVVCVVTEAFFVTGPFTAGGLLFALFVRGGGHVINRGPTGPRFTFLRGGEPIRGRFSRRLRANRTRRGE